MSLIAITSCGGRQPASTVPDDPIGAVAIAPLPLASLSGANTLVLTVGAVVFGDSAHSLDARRTAMLEAANASLDTALRRDAREVNWQGLPEQRRAMRRSPTLGVDPDRLGTSALVGARVEQVPDPLWAGLRTLSAITGARYAVVPAAVKVTGTPGSWIGQYVLVVVDARTGQVLWRGRTDGRPQPTPEAALASAAGAVVPSPIQ